MMEFHRRSIRLPGYNYSSNGYYFVTICVNYHACLLGHIANEEMRLNDIGRMVKSTWLELPNHYSGISLDKWIIMPNHIHGIIIVGAGSPACPNSMSLSEIIHRFKSLTTNKYITGVKDYGWIPFPKHFWQRNYYEHIIRNEQEYYKIQQYIENNVINWENDKLFKSSA